MKMASTFNATVLFVNILPLLLRDYTLGGSLPLIIWIHNDFQTSKYRIVLHSLCLSLN